MYRKNLGEQIRDIVEDAVDSCDFHDLNNKIKSTADRAIDEFNRATERFQYNGGVYRDAKRQQRFENREYRKEQRQGQPYGQGPFYQRPGYDYGQSRYQNVEKSFTAPRPPIIKRASRYQLPGSISGVLYTVFGSIGTVGFGIASVVLAAVSRGLGGWNPVLPMLSTIFGIVATGSALMLGAGIYKNNRIRRYKRYDEIIGPTNYCEIKRLADGTGKSKKYVLRDLRKMIALGFFKEGHIDEAGSCIMLGKHTYEQYLLAMHNYRQRKVEEEKKEKEKPKELDPELKKAMEAGQDYIDKLKRANERIPGKEISDKLYRLEDIISKIFICVEKRPNKLPEIRKFMEYYLPITLKLVNAYKEFDAQPIQGENISKSKKEIEDTLDTINTAFEKLLDSLYEDEAMEVSSDISVLNTLFAQEGLTKKDFELK